MLDFNMTIPPIQTREGLVAKGACDRHLMIPVAVLFQLLLRIERHDGTEIALPLLAMCFLVVL